MRRTAVSIICMGSSSGRTGSRTRRQKTQLDHWAAIALRRAVRTYTGILGGQVTPDGFSVNTTQPPYQPSGIPPAPAGRLTSQTHGGSARWGQPLP
jgi:hypothetical protein